MVIPRCMFISKVVTLHISIPRYLLKHITMMQIDEMSLCTVINTLLDFYPVNYFRHRHAVSSCWIMNAAELHSDSGLMLPQTAPALTSPCLQRCRGSARSPRRTEGGRCPGWTSVRRRAVVGGHQHSSRSSALIAQVFLFHSSTIRDSKHLSADRHRAEAELHSSADSQRRHSLPEKQRLFSN